MFKFTFQITANQTLFVQYLYVYRNMVINSLLKKKSVYLKHVNAIYMADDILQTLSTVEFEKVKTQLAQLTKSIGEINIQIGKSDIYLNEFETNVFHCKNNNNSPAFKSELKVIKIPELINSSYHDYIEIEMQNQCLKVALQPDELIAFNNTEIIIGGNSFIQKSELISIEKGLFINEFNLIDKYKLLD